MLVSRAAAILLSLHPRRLQGVGLEQDACLRQQPGRSLPTCLSTSSRFRSSSLNSPHTSSRQSVSRSRCISIIPKPSIRKSTAKSMTGDYRLLHKNNTAAGLGLGDDCRDGRGCLGLLPVAAAERRTPSPQNAWTAGGSLQCRLADPATTNTFQPPADAVTSSITLALHSASCGPHDQNNSRRARSGTNGARRDRTAHQADLP